MILIVGLGNPGKKYQNTRHNVGFMIVESLKHAPYRNEVSGAGLKVKSFSDWQNNKKLRAEISKGEINGQKVILAKPQTFMNESGKAVKLLIRNWKLKIKNLIVIHDDLDLPLGKMRISLGRGSAGHKGVQSIIDALGTKDFTRIRVGTLPQSGRPENTEKFVLENFGKEEKKIIDEVIEKICEEIEILIKK